MVFQGSILGTTRFLLCNNNYPADVVDNLAIYADDTTFNFKFDRASDLQQKFELLSELESDIRDTVDWVKKCLINVSAKKIQFNLFDCFSSYGAIVEKMDGNVLNEKLSFEMLQLSFTSQRDWGSYIFYIAKTASKKWNVDLLHALSLF